MSYPIFVQSLDDQFTAHIIGADTIRATALTRLGAIESLENLIIEYEKSGQLTVLPHTTFKPVSDFAGIFADDETLDDIVLAAYAERDAELAGLED